MVLKELHEEGKFDELKKHWASVKGIEAARTVHALFEVYEKENGVILTREDLAAVLKMLGCHNLLWEIRELCCGSELFYALDFVNIHLLQRGIFQASCQQNSLAEKWVVLPLWAKSDEDV